LFFAAQKSTLYYTPLPRGLVNGWEGGAENIQASPPETPRGMGRKMFPSGEFYPLIPSSLKGIGLDRIVNAV